MLKKILIAIALLIVVLIVAVSTVVMFAPTDFAVEREIVINKPRADVFEYVKHIKSQSEWGPWFKKDPNMKQEFRGTDGQVGFVSHWKGDAEEIGEGEQEIKRIVPNERVDTELRFKSPFESRADAYLITEDAGENKTKVRWGFNSEFPRPMNLFLVVADMDAVLGKDYEEGLSSLKTILESS